MESLGRPYDPMPHEAVISNLLDLQARLRGDPASMIIPRVGRPKVPDFVNVEHQGLVVTEVPEPAPSSNDASVRAPYDAADRIDVLRRRLQFLELEIDAYENAIAAAPAAPADAVVEADVSDLQQADERRLSED